MAVKKKINPTIEKFIENGAKVKGKDEKTFKNVLIRIPACMLQSIDDLIEEKPWLNRTQWIVEAIHEKLNSEIEN